MNENEIREPIQKRSIEKKERIIKCGFDLICEKGYYNTNTAEIAKKANVSTGIVYQYFKDKHDILIAGIEKYASHIFYPMLLLQTWQWRFFRYPEVPQEALPLAWTPRWHGISPGYAGNLRSPVRSPSPHPRLPHHQT